MRRQADREWRKVKKSNKAMLRRLSIQGKTSKKVNGKICGIIEEAKSRRIKASESW